jgi:hypothetical protein
MRMMKKPEQILIENSREAEENLEYFSLPEETTSE